jgi:hypothetical protein
MGIESELRRHEDDLMKLPNVQAVGIGEKAGHKVIKVMVAIKVPKSSLAAEEVIPEMLGGFEVDVEEIGTIEAQDADLNEEEEK